MRRQWTRAVVLAAVVGSLLAPSSPPAQSAIRLPPDCLIPYFEGCHSPNLTHVANIRYGRAGVWSQGTDLEFAEIGGRRYAVAGSYRNGMHIIDITDPSTPRVTSVMDCAIAQGDVQILQRDDRTYVVYAIDNFPGNDRRSACYAEAGYTGSVDAGFVVVDISDPAHPDPLTFTPWANGSHNTTIHPGGRYLYNSNADLKGTGALEIFDLASPTGPVHVRTVSLGKGRSSHDVTFNDDGTRAYSAALNHTLVLDTSAPSDPSIIGRLVDRTIKLHHQADPLTVDDPILGRRTFLVVSDELGAGRSNLVCPGGALHVFDITGALERAPRKVGLFATPDIRQTNTSRGRCTSHVFRAYPEQRIMTIGWYSAGVRVIDISALAGISAGVHPDLDVASVGMREVGHAFFPDSDTWAAKVDRFEPDGSFYVFASDTVRGFDVFRFDARAPKQDAVGRWRVTAATSDRRSSAARPYCLIGPASTT